MNNNENENDFDASYDEEPASGGTFTLDDIENLEFDDAGENESPAFEEVLEKGAEKARKSAKATMELVREAMGLNYY